jgi:cobalt-zinc-cadmium efflux system membrane fusion protein
MAIRLRNLPLTLLGQLPTVLTLALLGGIAWWGYVWDWQVPTLPELLDPSAARSRAERENKGEEEKKSEDEHPGPQGLDKPLPPIKLRSEEAMEEVGIVTKPVEERLIDEYVKAHGHIDYDQNHYAHLSTRASGTAWSVHKRQGDAIKKGEVLALIASPELASIKFDFQQKLLMVKSKERYYKRLKGAKSAAIPKDVDSSEFALREARVELSKDQQSLQNLGLDVPLDELTRDNVSDEQVAVRLRTLGISDTLLQGLDPNAVTGNNLLPMYAPFDGIVVNRDIVIGEMVTPAKPQFHLADLRHLWICMHVRQEDISRLRDRQEVRFHLDATDEDAPPTRITWISAEVDEKTRTIAVRAEVDNAQGRLRPNTFGDARIVVGRQKRLIVPNEALQFDGRSFVVFVRGQSPTEFQPHRVQLGPRHKDFTIVQSGIEAGQNVAVSGSHVLLSEMLKERIAGED